MATVAVALRKILQDVAIRIIFPEVIQPIRLSAEYVIAHDHESMHRIMII